MPTPTRDSRSPRANIVAPSSTKEARALIQRVLDTPQLALAVPRLAPELLHQVILRGGLEASGELLAMATPAQLERVADLDLWRSAQPGLDEQFDARRFEAWLEALLECGADVAARTVTRFDASLVTAGLAHHLRVFDVAASSPYVTTDGEQMPGMRAPGATLTIGLAGYQIVARRTDISWDAIVDVLRALAQDHGDYFHRVMRGCRTLSQAGREVDGLDHLLTDAGQAAYDLASAREQRREDRGFLAPPEARAFLEASRHVRLDGESAPAFDPLAHAYFRLARATAAPAGRDDTVLAAGLDDAAEADAAATAVAALTGVLAESGLLAGPPRALLDTPGETPRLRQIHAHLQNVLDHDPGAHSRRMEELGYLANALMAGCSIQSRSFTAPEAWAAATAVCNLGLENWPHRWHSHAAAVNPVDRNLVTVFQVGWTVLHDEVCLLASGDLIDVLKSNRVPDRETQAGLNALRRELTRQVRAGTPWKAREAMDVIATLDTPAWAALLGLIDECPVIHAALGASVAASPRGIDPGAFEFVSENVQIASVRAFLHSLPATLRP